MAQRRFYDAWQFMNALRNILEILVVRRRLVNGLLALVCAALMGFALFAQYGLQLEPCPLCVLQRVAVISVGLILLLACLHGPGKTGARVYGLLAASAATLGALVAGRHIWLQGLPAGEVPACGPGLDYMLDVFPLTEVLRMVFTGSGECAEIVWQFLGLSMPGWVLVWCVFLFVAALVVNLPAVQGPAAGESA